MGSASYIFHRLQSNLYEGKRPGKDAGSVYDLYDAGLYISSIRGFKPSVDKASSVFHGEEN